MAEHLNFQINTTGTYPAWNTTDKSCPVTSADFTGTRVHNRFPDTGATIKSRKFHSQGMVSGAGNIAMRGYGTGILPWLFRSFLTDTAVAVAGVGFDNDLLPDDTIVQLPWFSFQQSFNGTVGQNARGCVLNNMTISATAGEELSVTADFLVNDTAKVGGNWADGATASPSIVAASYTPAAWIAPLRFHEGAIVIGDGYTQTGNKMVSSGGGSTVATIEAFNLTIALNAEMRYPVRDGMPTAGYTRHGERNIEITCDIDWAAYATTYYDAMKIATESAIRLDFVSDAVYGGSDNYEMHITLPNAVYPEDGGPFPQLDGTHLPKLQAIKFIAMEDDSLTKPTDIGVSFQTLDDLNTLVS